MDVKKKQNGMRIITVSIEEEYLQSLLSEIKRLKEQGRKGLYKINANIPDNTAKYITEYFTGRTDYTFESRRCMNCKGTWDIIIVFK
jgi:hypothetical protein